MPLSGGGVRLSGGPVLSDVETLMLESDASSVISISDTLRVSDTEEELDGGLRGLEDRQKYRLPDPGKTRLDLRTKEPLSPTPRQVHQQSQQQDHHSPTTPRSRYSPMRDFDYASPMANGSRESVNEGESVIPSLSRSNSLYTLGRASLQDQLARLTSMKLPDAGSLAKRISDIPSSAEAAKALSDASEQISRWISKATEVLRGLNAEDDVEWAAAGGREGIEDVDKAISRFDSLVEVYLISIDGLQTRPDISDLSPAELKNNVQQMEGIMASWSDVKKMLNGVKEQVELAMEWEQLWYSVLGEVGQEMQSLNGLVFEMEERRHSGAGAILTSKDSIELGDLETIIEERPSQRLFTSSEHPSGKLFSAVAQIEASPTDATKEDSSLLALFARMQPLRASLDFLPMRLSVFHIRGKPIFPSACQDLHNRCEQLEKQWKKLEADAEFLRRELGEDRWIVVFRNAGRQALKMCESITRSFTKLRESVDTVEHDTNGPSYVRKVESYAAKKTHYGPAIGRVLAIIDRGVQERLTVNGEILRLQSDMKERWNNLQAAMKDLDLTLEELALDLKDKQLRDSVSTVLSSERSVASSLINTPGSSPASSVVGDTSYQGSQTPTPLGSTKTRVGDLSRGSEARRFSSRSPLTSSIPRRVPLTQSSPAQTRSMSPSPLAARAIHKANTRQEPAAHSRPRWSYSTRLDNRDYRSLASSEPSPYAKAPVQKRTEFLRSTRAVSQPITPVPSNQQSRIVSTPATTPAMHTVSNLKPTDLPASSSLSSPPNQTSSSSRSLLPVPSSAPARPSRTPIRHRSRDTLRTPSSSTTSTRRSSGVRNVYVDGNDADSEDPPFRRSSRTIVSISVREEKPRWRP